MYQLFCFCGVRGEWVTLEPEYSDLDSAIHDAHKRADKARKPVRIIHDMLGLMAVIYPR